MYIYILYIYICMYIYFEYTDMNIYNNNNNNIYIYNIYIYIYDDHMPLIFHLIKLGNHTSKTWVLRFASHHVSEYAFFWCYLSK